MSVLHSNRCNASDQAWVKIGWNLQNCTVTRHSAGWHSLVFQPTVSSPLSQKAATEQNPTLPKCICLRLVLIVAPSSFWYCY